MNRALVISIAGLLFLSACNDGKKPSNANFTRAINQYLARHGETCTIIDRPFPIDVPLSEQKEQYGTGPQLEALEQAGLVRGSNTTAVVHGMLDALRGSTPPQRVRRYELTAGGKKYFQEIPGAIGQTGVFCYGQKSVGSIVKWTEPMTTGAFSQSEVTYTYKIVNLAGWAHLRHPLPYQMERAALLHPGRPQLSAC